MLLPLDFSVELVQHVVAEESRGPKIDVMIHLTHPMLLQHLVLLLLLLVWLVVFWVSVEPSGGNLCGLTETLYPKKLCPNCLSALCCPCTDSKWATQLISVSLRRHINCMLSGLVPKPQHQDRTSCCEAHHGKPPIQTPGIAGTRRCLQNCAAVAVCVPCVCVCFFELLLCSAGELCPSADTVAVVMLQICNNVFSRP